MATYALIRVLSGEQRGSKKIGVTPIFGWGNPQRATARQATPWGASQSDSNEFRLSIPRMFCYEARTT